MPGKSKRRRNKKHGGGVSMEFPKPSVSNTSVAGAIQASMHKQRVGNQEMTDLNKQFSGGGSTDGEGIVVPQMNQAGDSGNDTIVGGIMQVLQGSADGEFDSDVHNTPKPDGMGGGRRRKTKRKKKKFKKHYMWNTKGKRYLAKTYKQHVKGAKLGHTHKKPNKKKKTKKKRKSLKKRRR
uniref:Uncharacterized protein n=1 Tax=viral metagenome TaxID=1070528 RepID=A0A6C0J9D6_9ZZZZ